ncbi:MAG: amidohydrolase family protein [Muribaculaceae bacterium]|nr:amidohydrolase family protein [Muribaculaceae bacterium]
MKQLFFNATIVNGNRRFTGYVVVDGEFIAEVGEGAPSPDIKADKSIDFEGDLLLPGVIDTHVHFRDGGNGNPKGDIATESEAALAGGVTTYFDMPNTTPPTIDREALEMKTAKAGRDSKVNYAFYLGATNSNYQELVDGDYTRVPGVKLFMGASTGNMLVDNQSTISLIFAGIKYPIAVHAESQVEITKATAEVKARYSESEEIPINRHPDIRPRIACVEAARQAINLARHTGARLHLLHLSTADEVEMFKPSLDCKSKQITTETCPHYLIFGGKDDYDKYGSRVKCNPSIKEKSDRNELRKAIIDGRIDVIATDHAPHLPSDKEGGALKAASGMPGVQFSLPLMLTLTKEIEGLTIERVVELMSHNPALIFDIDRRGFIKEGYFADIVRVKKESSTIHDNDVKSRCGWTPYAGFTTDYRVIETWVNGGNQASQCRFSRKNS